MGLTTLKTENNDFVFSNNRLTQISESNALAQIISNRLRMQKGEWFANIDAGVDWITFFNQDKKAPMEKRARILIKNTILADPRIKKINKLEIEYNNTNREMTINFEAQADDEQISISVSI